MQHTSHLGEKMVESNGRVKFMATLSLRFGLSDFVLQNKVSSTCFAVTGRRLQPLFPRRQNVPAHLGPEKVMSLSREVGM